MGYIAIYSVKFQILLPPQKTLGITPIIGDWSAIFLSSVLTY
jgi:hypothetical protein